jgi:DNA processing protein
VTDAEEAAELLGRIGDDLAPERTGPSGPEDRLAPPERAVLDALPFRRPVAAGEVARLTTLALGDVVGALGRLELSGMAARDADGWRKTPRRSWAKP